MKDKSAIARRLIPGLAVGGVLALSFLGSTVGIFGSLTSYGYGSGGCHDGLVGAAAMGDFNGDGKSDLLVVNNVNACVLESNLTGTHFASLDAWSGVPFFGNRDYAIVGNVTGGSTDSVVAVNNTSTWVMTSTGSQFNFPQQWSSTAFHGTIGTFLADVNGDGRADLVAVNNTSVWVMLSTGTSFSAPAIWSSTPFFGTRDTLMGDFNGDRKADIVSINDTSTWVETANAGGTAFNTPVQWSPTPFFGLKINRTGDVTGDGKADIVAVNWSSQWILAANTTGNGFLAPAQGSPIAFYGIQGTFTGNVTGSGGGRNDLIAVNPTSVWVETSNGSTLSAPQQWYP